MVLIIWVLYVHLPVFVCLKIGVSEVSGFDSSVEENTD